jgi:hypothetical protein
VQPSENLDCLADSLRDVSRLPTREFIEHAMYVTLEDRCRRLAELKRRLSIDDSYPPHWRAAVAEYLDAFRASVTRRGYYLPVEFKGKEAFGQVRAFIGQFAELLKWWPHAVQSSRR